MDDVHAASPATRRFRDLAERVLDAALESAPQTATELGDHRFDDRLDDLTAEGVENRVAILTDALSALDDVDDGGLDVGDRVDLDLLRTGMARDLWSLGELRDHETNPLVHLPADALYPLLVRETGDPADRLRSVIARMAAVPARLDNARRVLHDMPRVHVETALVQAAGTLDLIQGDLDDLLARAPALAGEVAPARHAAAQAVGEYAVWLEAQLPVSDGDPRLGSLEYAAQLWYTLDTETVPDALLTRAESDLQAVEEEIAEEASRIAGAPPRPGQVREVLDRLAGEAPVSQRTVLPLCERALTELTRRMADLDLVTVPADPVRIIVMPPSRRGVAGAYCDAPGPLEAGEPLATLLAVSPPPADWDGEAVASFYREDNGHMLRNLVVHEAMPGHAVQLAHAGRYRGATRVRAASTSGTFVEGWAVFAEELVAAAGLGLGPDLDAALRMQRLKMLLRTTINAILDVRVHTRGMTREEAMTLMIVRGHQEEAEAAGKWRRALLSSAQLSTYYVGYHEVRDLVGRLSVARPQAGRRELHDTVLSQGSPPPRHLRALFGVEQD